MLSPLPSTTSSSDPDPARLIAAAVPALVARLLVSRPDRVHREALALLERPLLAHALSLTRGNQLRAARLLGLNRNTLRKRCQELGLARPRSAASAPGAPEAVSI